MQGFLDNLDNLLREHKLEEVKVYLEDSLEKAIKSKNTSLIILILNEAIGFYRDITNYDISVKYAKTLDRLISRLDVDINAKFISKINIANALRANSDYEDALRYFIEAKEIYFKNKINNIREYAALLNNLALLYTAQNRYVEAIDTYLESLSILEEKDIYRKATCFTNISSVYLKKNDLKKAKMYLDKAEEIFERDIEKDFHYSGYLVQKAFFYEKITDIESAIKYYELSLSYLLSTVGKNDVYQEVYIHLKELVENLGTSFHTKGLIINQEYYKTYFYPKLVDIPDLKNKIVVGSFGFGSEMFDLDDEFSEDHDFEPGFIVLVDDKVPKEQFEKLKAIYDSMPNHYRRYFIQNKANRNGVFYLSNWLKSIGIEDKITEESAYYLTNGEIYLDNSNLMHDLRNRAWMEYDNDYIEKLYRIIIKLAQSSEYNINRQKKRGETLCASYLAMEFNLNLVKYCFLILRKYFVSTKWSLKQIINEVKITEYKPYLEKAFTDGLDELDYHNISKLIVKYLSDNDFVKYKGTNFILDYQNEFLSNVKDYYDKIDLVKKIVETEWNLFQTTINEGGRANCQDNFSYFNLMRKSQYLVFSKEILESFFYDLNDAQNKGYNLITNKYAYMQESTDYESFLKIKDQIPTISDKRKALQEEVISLQMSQVQSFLKEYPKAMSFLRKIYTKEDTKVETSYETYLRGELSTYSDKTLILYAKFLIKLENENQSITKKIIAKTCFLSGINIDIYK